MGEVHKDSVAAMKRSEHVYCNHDARFDTRSKGGQVRERLREAGVGISDVGDGRYGRYG